jgi:hypothetical protein
MKSKWNNERRNMETQIETRTQLDAHPLRHTARTSAIAALRVARQRHDKKGISVKVEDLSDYLQTHYLRVVGGNPDLIGEPWQPQVSVVRDTV